jgi:hypothetical protein
MLQMVSCLLFRIFQVKLREMHMLSICCFIAALPTFSILPRLLYKVVGLNLENV